jgi:hypothetical protein
MNDQQGLEARVGARLIVPLRFFAAVVVLAAAVFSRRKPIMHNRMQKRVLRGGTLRICSTGST